MRKLTFEVIFDVIILATIIGSIIVMVVPAPIDVVDVAYDHAAAD